MTNNHVATWIGNKVQTNTLLDKLVFLKINGKNYGLMEMVEQPTKKYEINPRRSDIDFVIVSPFVTMLDLNR